MEFSQQGKIGFTALVGLVIVMPILYFTSDRPQEIIAASTEEASEQVAAAGSDESFAREPAPILPPQPLDYIEVLDSCAPHYEGACVNVRTGPGVEYPAVATLRTGVVLRVQKVIHGDDRDWYKITFDEWVRYPERVSHEWYVAADVVQLFSHLPAEKLADDAKPVTAKRILVDRSEQKLFAYDGETLFMEQTISTGLDDTPTPRGQFLIFSKTPTRYMQGPVPGISDQEFDLPGVPWTMYFTNEGGAIHGAYWHDSFGQQWSHGCVNLPPPKAKELYEWADLGTPVTVRD